MAVLGVVCLLLASLGVNGQMNFIAMGDWGGEEAPPYSRPAEVDMARIGMPKIVKELNSQFVFALGDNFYSHGVTNDRDQRFNSTWESVFNDKHLNMPFYVCCGNHDHRGNCSAQIEFTKLDPTHRWTFPDFNYTFTRTFTGSDGKHVLAQFVLIDTVLLAGQTEDDDPFAQVVPPVGAEEVALSDRQLTWLKSVLKSSVADYLFVGGHYPVYSGCSHGNTRDLVSKVKPLLEKYNAHSLSGHDHCLQHIDEGTGVQYLQTGAGVECSYKPSNVRSLPSNSLKYILSRDNNPKRANGGFISVTLDSSYAYATYYNQKGDVLYTTPKFPPRHSPSLATLTRDRASLLAEE